LLCSQGRKMELYVTTTGCWLIGPFQFPAINPFKILGNSICSSSSEERDGRSNQSALPSKSEMLLKKAFQRHGPCPQALLGPPFELLRGFPTTTGLPTTSTVVCGSLRKNRFGLARSPGLVIPGVLGDSSKRRVRASPTILFGAVKVRSVRAKKNAPTGVVVNCQALT
jgi:hypothetical protein